MLQQTSKNPQNRQFTSSPRSLTVSPSSLAQALAVCPLCLGPPRAPAAPVCLLLLRPPEPSVPAVFPSPPQPVYYVLPQLWIPWSQLEVKVAVAPCARCPFDCGWLFLPKGCDWRLLSASPRQSLLRGLGVRAQPFSVVLLHSQCPCPCTLVVAWAESGLPLSSLDPSAVPLSLLQCAFGVGVGSLGYTPLLCLFAALSDRVSLSARPGVGSLSDWLPG